MSTRWMMTGTASTDNQTLEQRMTSDHDGLIQSVETFVRRGDTESDTAYSLRIAQFFTHSNSTLEHIIDQAGKNDVQNNLTTVAMAGSVQSAERQLSRFAGYLNSRSVNRITA
jgi:hypothetical protein